jgi:Fe-S cluster assembly protein SufD
MTADIRPIRTMAETGLAAAFATVRGGLAPGEIARRDAAFALFHDSGLPHRRVEEWKYTDLRAAMREASPLAEPNGVATLGRAKAALAPLEGLASTRLVLVNGQYVKELSTGASDGLDVLSLAEAITSGSPLLSRLGEAPAPAHNAAVALNTAFASDGLIIRVPADVAARPLHVAFHQDGDHASYARVLVLVEAGASATVIETHTGIGTHQTNTLVEVIIGDGAKVSHVKLQDETRETLHLATLAAKLGADAGFVSTALAKGASLARQQVFITFAGEGSEVTLSGVTLAGGKRHLDTTLVVDHAVPNCASRERYKTVLNGQSRGVFQGKIVVRRHAQKTDGQMKSDALLLSDEAEADLKPELEIYADDVVCAHGATAGAIDDELLFYLLSRGIPRAEAESLLITAFVGEVFDLVEDEAVREHLETAAQAWLSDRV